MSADQVITFTSAISAAIVTAFNFLTAHKANQSVKTMSATQRTSIAAHKEATTALSAGLTETQAILKETLQGLGGKLDEANQSLARIQGRRR